MCNKNIDIVLKIKLKIIKQGIFAVNKPGGVDQKGYQFCSKRWQLGSVIDIHYFTPIGLPVDCLSAEDLQSANLHAPVCKSVCYWRVQGALRLIKNRSVQPRPTSFHFRSTDTRYFGRLELHRGKMRRIEILCTIPITKN